MFICETSDTYSIDSPVTATEIIDKAKCLLANTLRKHGEAMTNPDTVRCFLHLHLAGLEREVFSCLFLDNRHRLIEYQELFQGTIDGASVYPREVVKAALLLNAAAVILAHNHPSGDPSPSDADKRITTRIKDALTLIDVRVLDHIVVGHGDSVSFAEQGLV